MERTLNILSAVATHEDLPTILNGTRQYPEGSNPQYLASISQRAAHAVTAIRDFRTLGLVYKPNTTEAELNERTTENSQYFNCLATLEHLKEEASYSGNLCKEDVDELVEGLDQAMFILDHKRKAEFEARAALRKSKGLHVVVTGTPNISVF